MLRRKQIDHSMVSLWLLLIYSDGKTVGTFAVDQENWTTKLVDMSDEVLWQIVRHGGKDLSKIAKKYVGDKK